MAHIDSKDAGNEQSFNGIERAQTNTIEKTFTEGRCHWIEEPVTSQWKTTDPKISTTLRDVNKLYHQWSASKPGLFCPFSDALWLQTCEILRDVGLPWLNNNLNLPDDIDPSWPFQFKNFERHAVIAKGTRVDDGEASGYICTWSEGNLYAIRALQQELRRQRPTKKPLLVASCMDPSVVEAAAQIFGLELFQFGDDWEGATNTLARLTSDKRPIIFAATLANEKGQADDFSAISRLSQALPLVLHVDASRNFDFVTSLSTSMRQRLGVPRLTLLQPRLDDPLPTYEEITICAATIVAAGMNCTYPPQVVVLKPRHLGSTLSRKVEYLKGSDNTLCGSRDAIGPLLVYLQEERFGVNGLREVYAQCLLNRQYLFDMLIERKVLVKMSYASLDMVVYPAQPKTCSLQNDWDLVHLDDGGFLLSIQPSVTVRHVEALAEALCGDHGDYDSAFLRPIHPAAYPLSDDVSNILHLTVESWRHSARSSGGYCLNQATYSALGSVIGRFFPIPIPLDWTILRGAEILQDRKTSFGLSDVEHDSFPACFTTGSTMGNRVGIHTALAYCPNAFIYFSAVTHYSVKKILSDSDDLSDQWSNNKRPQFAAVPADELGRMIPEGLVKQVTKDKAFCETHGQPHEIILLVNIGTTFTGGRDDVLSLRQALHNVGSEVAYIHADGALDFGFSSNIVCLGRPDIMTKNDLPIVQGITLSHHKAFGIMVSGEVICYSPTDQKLATVVHNVEPRVVFEIWFFQEMYLRTDLTRMSQYCLQNASRLRIGLKATGVLTRYNIDSIVTLLERPPAWIIHQFHLAPEEDWVHYITMPHISPSAVDEFVESLAFFARHFATALHQVESDLKAALGQDIKTVRIRCLDPIIFSRIFVFSKEVSDKDLESRGKASFPNLDEFKRRYAYGSTSFAALDLNDEPLVVFLAETTLYKTMFPRPVLVHGKLGCEIHTIQLISSRAFIVLSDLLGLAVQEDGW